MNYGFFFYIFLYISEKYFQLRKKQKPFLGRRFRLPQTSKPDLLTAELFSKLCIPQRYVQNFERNWKNSVCIGVNNFANL